MASSVQIFKSTSEDDTQQIGRDLADLLGPGDCVLLDGDLGAGKSAFARAVIRHLSPGITDVPSPTFTLVQVYPGIVCDIWHSDLYRLSGPEEIIELGLDDAMVDQICLIEWPKRLGNDLPQGANHLSFAFGAAETDRTLTLTGPLAARLA